MIEPLGPDMLVYAQCGRDEVVAKADARSALRPGDPVLLTAGPDALHVFDAATGVVL